MTNAKISDKAKALFKNRQASAAVAKEIVRQSERLSSSGKIVVAIGDKKLTVKLAS